MQSTLISYKSIVWNRPRNSTVPTNSGFRNVFGATDMLFQEIVRMWCYFYFFVINRCVCNGL